jgi:hypothetical protein
VADTADGESVRTCREDLDALYVMLVRAEAVIGDSQPLVREIREIYESACAQADPWTLRRHQQERSRLRKGPPTAGLG